MELRFNAYDYDPSQGGSICFPLADYKLEITAAEPKIVKDNPGAGYLELSLTVVEGDLRGMVQKHRLNLFNPSEVAKRIAHQELSAIAIAIERPYLQTTEQMIGGRLIATIGPQADDSKYSEVKVIKCKDGTAPTRNGAPAPGPAQPQGQVMPPQQPAFPTAPAAPPWGTPPPTTQQAPAQPPWGTTAPAPAPAQTVPVPPWGNSAPAPTSAPTSAPPWAK